MTAEKSKSDEAGSINSDNEDNEDYFDEPGGRTIDGIYIPPPPPKQSECGVEKTGVRLIITKIENINFKSYAGKQTLGPFHKCFTSIVGPNGSGKSNVIDSMLFVFGYRGQKLRAKKLSILIHKSENYMSLDSCRVNVHFALINDKPGQDYEIIPNSEFVVSRTALKDNTSYYCINNKRVQFKEVSQLLQSHGIDLRYNRFLILQGEVEQIALMKPKAETEHESGMLEFLEDIIGTTRLREPLNKFAQRVEETNETRAEKINRVKVVEKELKSLEEAKDEAIKFLELENQIGLVRSRLFQVYMNSACDTMSDAQVEYDRANQILTRALEDIDKLKKEKEDKEKELNEMNEEFSRINKIAEDLNEIFKDCERRDVQLREKLKNTKTRGKKLQSDIELENKKYEKLLEQPDKIKEEIQLLESKKVETEKEHKESEEHLAKVMGEIKHDTEALQKKKDDLESKLLQLQKGVNEARSSMEIAQSEYDLYLSQEQSEKAQLEQLNFKLNRAISDSQSKRNALKEYQKQIPDLEEKIKNLNEEIETLLADRQRVQEQYKLNKEKFEEMRNSAAAFTSRNKVLNALMEQKRKGTLKGIFGRLGDLGGIDKTYDIAVSTACGALDNIVTDTLDNAQKCVQYLKDHNIGQSTFIALDKLRVSWRDGDKFPEGVPRLFDLIRVNDERVKSAFYYALRDTLVANDLEQATRIAYGKTRYRVVTLNGELIEQTGSMSGGGRPMSGRMGSSVTVVEFNDSQIREQGEVVERFKAKINEIKNKQDDLKRELDQTTKDCNIMKQNRPQYEMEVKRYEELENALKKSIKDQESKVKSAAPDPTQVKKLEQKLLGEKDHYNTELSKTTDLEDKVQDLNNKIKEIMDKKVGTARKKAQSLKEQANKINSDLAKTKVSLTTTERNIKKSEEKIKTMEEDKEEIGQTYIATKESIKKLEEEAKDVTEKYQQAVDKRAEQADKIKEVQSTINKIKAKESKLNADNLDAKHEAEQFLAKLKEKEAEVKKWDDKIKSLEFHDIDGKQKPTVQQLTKEEVEQLNPSDLQKEIDSLENNLKKMKPNMAAINEYKKKEQVYIERSKELEEITNRRDLYKKHYEEVRQQRINEFKDGFITINRKLKEMYRLITMGGDAELEFIDSLDPFSEGISFGVRPNKKTWKKIINLSGGEKTLSSLALIFALHHYKASPLYVMDEIDAALDFRNVSIVANYIKERTKNTQFIIISLRNNMYELADRLVGIYKFNNCTKSITLNPLALEARLVKKTITMDSPALTSGDQTKDNQKNNEENRMETTT